MFGDDFYDVPICPHVQFCDRPQKCFQHQYDPLGKEASPLFKLHNPTVSGPLESGEAEQTRQWLMLSSGVRLSCSLVTKLKWDGHIGITNGVWPMHTKQEEFRQCITSVTEADSSSDFSPLNYSMNIL